MNKIPETHHSRLTLDETIQKFLVSTTSRFIGEYETDGMAIRHSWPSFANAAAGMRLVEGPISRSGFVLILATEAYEKAPGVPVPSYSHVPDVICACLSVLYGKRFDTHGALEWSGHHGLPDLTVFSTVSQPNLPWNKHASRVDFPIPLHLNDFHRFDPLLQTKTMNKAKLRAFFGAASFYLRALRSAEQDPEVAYLHLITVGEILANATDHDTEALLDDAAKSALSRIEKEMPSGLKVAKFFRGRLRQVKRRFVATLVNLIDLSFFSQTESHQPLAAFKHENFRDALAASYDLRSRFVHSGMSFGSWIAPRHNHWLGEVQLGRPSVGDREMEEILAIAPTFIGLERIIRYSLISFARELGADVKVAPS